MTLMRMPRYMVRTWVNDIRCAVRTYRHIIREIVRIFRNIGQRCRPVAGIHHIILDLPVDIVNIGHARVVLRSRHARTDARYCYHCKSRYNQDYYRNLNKCKSISILPLIPRAYFPADWSPAALVVHRRTLKPTLQIRIWQEPQPGYIYIHKKKDSL